MSRESLTALIKHASLRTLGLLRGKPKSGTLMVMRTLSHLEGRVKWLLLLGHVSPYLTSPVN